MTHTPDHVEQIAGHLEGYLQMTGRLTALLDEENQLLLFETGELKILEDKKRQQEKQALYAQVETLARIVTHTIQSGRAEDVEAIRSVMLPLESFRRSLRLNSALLEVNIERQERRLRRITTLIEHIEAGRKTRLATEDAHVADRRL